VFDFCPTLAGAYIDNHLSSQLSKCPISHHDADLHSARPVKYLRILELQKLMIGLKTGQ